MSTPYVYLHSHQFIHGMKSSPSDSLDCHVIPNTLNPLRLHVIQNETLRAWLQPSTLAIAPLHFRLEALTCMPMTKTTLEQFKSFVSISWMLRSFGGLTPLLVIVTLRHPKRVILFEIRHQSKCLLYPQTLVSFYFNVALLFVLIYFITSLSIPQGHGRWID